MASPQKYEPMLSIDNNDGVDESFIKAVNYLRTAVTAPEAQPYLEVVAPATLPEVSFFCCRVWLMLMSGLHNVLCMWYWYLNICLFYAMQISQMVHHYHKGYTFEAETNGQVFTVTVPIGGVEEGQKFSVPFPSGQDGYSGVARPRSSVPGGHWKDDVCACCGLGLCHTVLWNTWCCPLSEFFNCQYRYPEWKIPNPAFSAHANFHPLFFHSYAWTSNASSQAHLDSRCWWHYCPDSIDIPYTILDWYNYLDPHQLRPVPPTFLSRWIQATNGCLLQCKLSLPGCSSCVCHL